MTEALSISVIFYRAFIEPPKSMSKNVQSVFIADVLTHASFSPMGGAVGNILKIVHEARKEQSLYNT